MNVKTFFNTLIEIIVILGFIAIGVTAITYVIQPDVTIDKTFVALIVLAEGACSVLEHLSLKSLAKLRNIPNLIASLLFMALGVVLLVINVETELLCIIWGISTIGISAVRITNYSFLLSQKPLVSGIKIILALVEVAFCIILLVQKNEAAIEEHIMFIGISLLIEASICLIQLFMQRH